MHVRTQVRLHVLLSREQAQHQGSESGVWSWKVGPVSCSALEVNELHPEAPLPADGPQGQGEIRV